MPQTQAGAIKAAATNKKRYGKDFYAKIGSKGGRMSHTGGFGSKLKGKDGLTGQQRAEIAGAKGGQISRRKGVPNA